MSVVVAKFGGTSVANPERIRSVAQRIVSRKRAGDSVVAVVSAMGKTTDDLVALASSISESPDPREMDTLLSTGEMVSMSLLAMAVAELGEEAISLSGRQIGLITDSVHGKASIREIHADRIRVALSEGRSLADAVRFAAHSASVSVTRMGAQASIPWRGELETLA